MPRPSALLVVQILITHRTFVLFVLALALLVSIYKDVKNTPAMPGDMRNRIVGSRIMKDGGSPYFSIWKEGDTVRYYDTYVAPNAVMSPATSTPFFHSVNGLIADLPQYQFNSIWLLLEYFALGACLLLASLAIPVPRSRMIVYLLAVITVFFTYTVGWRIHVHTGQNYIFVPMLAMACYYTVVQKINWLHLLLFGVAACSLVLLRPIALLFFLPHLFYLKSYYKWFCSAAVLMLVYIVFVFSNPVQKVNWSDYFKSVQVGIAIHQQLLPPAKAVPYNPAPIRSFEGINFDTEGNEKLGGKINAGAENSNFFILYNELTGHKLPVVAMTIMGLVTCAVMLLPLLIVVKKKLPFSVIQLFLLGFLIYNTYEFFYTSYPAVLSLGAILISFIINCYYDKKAIYHSYCVFNNRILPEYSCFTFR